MSITENIDNLRKTIPDGVKLVAVSKFHPSQAILEAYNAGQRIFGESRMQEINVKYTELPNDIEWHFIGHLQTNKVKTILPYTHVIQSVDSWKLLQEIEKQAMLQNKKIACLLEIHIAEEDAKCGFSFDECRQLLAEEKWRSFEYAQISGVMGMATNTNNEVQIRNEFKNLRLFFNELKNDFFIEDSNFKEISMGMSNDYKLAIEEGSTMVRIGSSIFGQREY